MPATCPTLHTERLFLDQPHAGDLEDVARMLNHEVFAANTTNIPFPYTIANAKTWLKIVLDGYDRQEHYVFAIREKGSTKQIGATGLKVDHDNNKAELGYWMSQEFWNKGYVTEAAKALVDFGFTQLKLKRIFATHFDYNPASGRVLEKIGMQREGFLKAHTFRNNNYQDHVLYAIINQAC